MTKRMLPPLRIRRQVDQLLVQFYTDYQLEGFHEAFKVLCGYYSLSVPTFEWYKYIGGGKRLAECVEDGQINLIHPSDWEKQDPPDNTCRRWVATVLHEVYHYLTFVDEEKKADEYARHFVRGLK